MTLHSSLRPEAADTPASGIVEVANAARAHGGVIQLWVGEGDLPTPAFVCEAATRALGAGETMYTWQRGIPEMRDAIARYMTRVYGRAFDVGRFSVTGGGMQAIQIALRMVAGPGDEVLIPSPAWPNFSAAARISGASIVEVPQAFGNHGFALDIEALERAVTPRSRVLIVNSPSNPTGWTATREELADALAFARRHGLWIIADEIYGRFTYELPRAPSLHDIRSDEDRIIFVQTMSKNWAMTGWRIGWIDAPPELAPTIENLIQFSTSGVPVFSQRAAIAALDHGDAFIDHQIERAGASRDLFCQALEQTGRARFIRPEGAFYLFFSIDGVADTRAEALRMIREIGVGLAPGTAFGAGGADWFRLCYLRSPERAAEAAGRIGRFFGCG